MLLKFLTKDIKIDCHYFSKDLFESDEYSVQFPPCALHPDCTSCANCSDYKKRELVLLVQPTVQLYASRFSTDFDLSYLGLEENTEYMWFISYGKTYYVSRADWKEYIIYRAVRTTLCDLKYMAESPSVVVTHSVFSTIATEAIGLIFCCSLITERC